MSSQDTTGVERPSAAGEVKPKPVKRSRDEKEAPLSDGDKGGHL